MKLRGEGRGRGGERGKGGKERVYSNTFNCRTYQEPDLLKATLVRGRM